MSAVPITVSVGAAVLTPAQREALAELDTGMAAVAVVQDPDRADVIVEGDGQRWHIEGDGNTHELRDGTA